MQQLLLQSPLTFALLIFLFALLVGSFLNVVIYRLPIMMEREWRAQAEAVLESPAKDLPEGRFDLIAPRSRCRACGAGITAMQNIPVISYLALRGKCGSCGAKISARYPIIEVVTALLSAAAAWRFGFGWEAAAAVVMTWVLVAITVIDIDYQLIPDSLSLPLLWLGILLSIWHPMSGADVLFIEPRTAIIGAAAGYISLWAVYHLYLLVTGKEGMGYGDFKLLAAFGAWLGWQMLPLIILLSAVVGATVGISLILFKSHDKDIPIPFGPYLAGAGWIAMMWGHEIVDAYLAYMK